MTVVAAPRDTPAATPGTGSQPPGRGRRRGVIAALVFVAVIAVALAAVRIAWPAPRVRPAVGAYGRITYTQFGEQLSLVRVTDSTGHPVAAAVRHGVVVALSVVASGATLTVRTTVRRAGWIGWLVGSDASATLTIRTPRPVPTGQWLTVTPGSDVTVSFSQPVRRVVVNRRLIALPAPVTRVDTGVASTATHRAGSFLISGAAEPWLAPPPPTRISWFPPSRAPLVITTPRLGATLQPGQRLTLTFSEPVRAVLGVALPIVSGGVSGRWRIRDPHRLVFTAYGAGFVPGRRVTVTLPRDVGVMTAAATQTVRQISWLVPRPAFARLQQLLAQQGYLPFRWVAVAGSSPARTLVAQEQAAVVPPAGHFKVRYRLPAALAVLWSPTSPTVITRAAVMVVERTHNLPVDGVAGSGVWSALIHDAVNGRVATGGYNYVEVSRARQHLTLYHNGRVVLAAAVNTGIPQAPTAAGSYPVFEHIPVGTMSGTNPDGTKYHDPGIPWISYFNGGDALHGFLRGSYGSPQSLGCVEMPFSVAGQVYPYTPVGTIVTVDA